MIIIVGRVQPWNYTPQLRIDWYMCFFLKQVFYYYLKKKTLRHNFGSVPFRPVLIDFLSPTFSNLTIFTRIIYSFFFYGRPFRHSAVTATSVIAPKADPVDEINDNDIRKTH